MPDIGLVIAGGYNRKNGLLDAAEMSDDLGVSFKALPSLPRAVHGACLVLSDGKAIIIGGFDGKYAIMHLMWARARSWLDFDSGIENQFLIMTGILKRKLIFTT